MFVFHFFKIHPPLYYIRPHQIFSYRHFSIAHKKLSSTQSEAVELKHVGKQYPRLTRGIGNAGCGADIGPKPEYSGPDSQLNYKLRRYATKYETNTTIRQSPQLLQAGALSFQSLMSGIHTLGFCVHFYPSMLLSGHEQIHSQRYTVVYRVGADHHEIIRAVVVYYRHLFQALIGAYKLCGAKYVLGSS